MSFSPAFHLQLKHPDHSSIPSHRRMSIFTFISYLFSFYVPEFKNPREIQLFNYIKFIPPLIFLKLILSNDRRFVKQRNTGAGCQLDFVKKKVFLKGLIFKKKGFCNKKKGFPCQMDSFLIPAKGFFTSCILK